MGLGHLFSGDWEINALVFGRDLDRVLGLLDNRSHLEGSRHHSSSRPFGVLEVLTRCFFTGFEL
jgi:hypothetical protein